MRTILVDDEPLAMERFCQVSRGLNMVEIVGRFTESTEAEAFVRKEKVDLAILDIEMPEMDGMELGRRLKKIRPEMEIIFITGHEQYALKAYGLHAAGYLLKPYNREEVEYAIQSAELLSKRQQHKVFVKTFGKFDVFVDGEPLFFKNSKSKELLALLVDAKGSTITSGYAISMLWEDKPFDENSQSLYYKAAKNLEKTLEEYGVEDILIKTRYERCVNRKKFECDYYSLLREDKDAVCQFHGEYMSQYSWAEETLAGILKFLEFVK